MADGVRQAGKLFVRMEEKGHISEAQLDQLLSNLAKKYSAFLLPYNQDKKPPISKYNSGHGTVAELFDKISDSPIGDTRHLARYYDAYGMYSKYEHFSAISTETIRRDVVSQANTLRSGIEMLLLHLYICVSMIYYYLKDEYLKQKLEEIGNYIQKEVHGISHDEMSNEL